MRYEITDHELGGAKTEIEAPGIAEAMFEYLPWPSLDIEINYTPSQGSAVITDRKTDFSYDLQAT